MLGVSLYSFVSEHILIVYAIFYHKYAKHVCYHERSRILVYSLLPKPSPLFVLSFSRISIDFLFLTSISLSYSFCKTLNGGRQITEDNILENI